MFLSSTAASPAHSAAQATSGDWLKASLRYLAALTAAIVMLGMDQCGSVRVAAIKGIEEA